MIEMKVSNKGIEAKVMGCFPEITNDFLNGFKRIYEAFKESDEANAEAFGLMTSLGIMTIVEGKDLDGVINPLFEELMECCEQDEEEEDDDEDFPKYSDFAKFVNKVMERRRK